MKIYAIASSYDFEAGLSIFSTAENAVAQWHEDMEVEAHVRPGTDEWHDALQAGYEASDWKGHDLFVIDTEAFTVRELKLDGIDWEQVAGLVGYRPRPDGASVERMREAIVDDWCDSALGDRDFLRSQMQRLAAEIPDDEVPQAYADAGLDERSDDD